MNGLGIMVDENHYDDILPPLPANQQDLKNQIQQIENIDLLTPLTDRFDVHSEDESDLYDLNNNTPKNDYINYELDSPNLLKSNFIDNSSNNSSQSHSETEKVSKLKSLKNSIRKLSLSTHNSPTVNTNTKSSSNKSINTSPILSCNSSSSNSSNEKMTNSPEKKYDFIKNWDRKSIDDFKVSRSQKHSPTNSISSTNTIQKSSLLRNRAISLTTSSICPLTPPLNSPLISVSENLNLPKKSLENIEQNFFDKLANSKVQKFTDLQNCEDLINYSQYLIYHKNNLIDAFNVAEKKLSESGWCSNHDINNLNLQQDASISQIDTRLLQIEEILNEEFNSSFLGNEVVDKQDYNGKVIIGQNQVN